MSYILRPKAFAVESGPIMAETAGIGLVRSDEEAPAGEHDYVFRWGCTARVPNGPKMVNKRSALLTVGDKRKFRLKCAAEGLAPRSWGTWQKFAEDHLDGNMGAVVIRPEEHARSEHIYLCKTPWSVIEAAEKIAGPLYISEYIPKVAEYRVMVVSGRAVWVIKKIPKDRDAVSWGCVDEGDFAYVGWDDWQNNVVMNAIASFNLSGLDFGAVDVIVSAKGEAFTLEINTAPAVTPYYAKTIGKAFKWIVEHGRDHIPAQAQHGYLGVIHPAVSNRAKV